MKPGLRAKFLQHLLRRQHDQGYTLIELLTTIVILVLQVTIALPSFLGQANRARQAEARQYVGSMNRGQQAYYVERGIFAPANKFADLALGIPQETKYYRYTIRGGGNNNTTVTNAAIARQGSTSPLKAYIGGVSINPQKFPVATLCEAQKAPVQGGDNASSNPTFTFNAPPACPGSYIKL